MGVGHDIPNFEEIAKQMCEHDIRLSISFSLILLFYFYQGCQVCVRVRQGEWTAAGDGRAQGQHHANVRRTLHQVLQAGGRGVPGGQIRRVLLGHGNDCSPWPRFNRDNPNFWVYLESKGATSGPPSLRQGCFLAVFPATWDYFVSEILSFILEFLIKNCWVLTLWWANEDCLSFQRFVIWVFQLKIAGKD